MQTENLFELTYILLAEKQVTAGEMAAHFGVSQRTIYRWVDALNLAGVPLYAAKGKGGGIRLSEKYALDKTIFTEEEKLELLSSVQALQALSGNKSASVSKLKALTRSDGDWIEIDFAPWNPKGEEVRLLFNSLKRAILSGRQVRFDYYSMKGEVFERIVEPWKIQFRGQAWYLQGFCHLKMKTRVFKLSRMRNLEILSEKVDEERKISAIREKKAVFEDGPLQFVQVEIKISESMIFRIMDEYKIVKFEDCMGDDGKKILTLQLPDLPWLVEYLLSFGSEIEVIGPEDIKTAYYAEVEKIWNKLQRGKNETDSGKNNFVSI